MNAGERPVLSSAFIEAWSSSRMSGEAGPRSYARGVSYHRGRRVELAEVGSNRVRALVRGTIPYNVTLGVSGGEPPWLVHLSGR